ncbi:hypothetical protein L4D09_12835 [Photobacterium makurazakiensis]|uniref:hypothetical protein n=1 Tax=Photobacterium makurazakiensis TaxID=2910234 RepID=UPI003D13C44C
MQEFKQLGIDILSTTMTLFKVMIPMIILIEIADKLGGVELLSDLLEPLMAILGLPSSMALVWATTMLTNLYAGILVLINTEATLTVAQVTVLSSLLLICHGLPLESTISKKAGAPLWAIVSLRVVGGLLFAWLQKVYFDATSTNQHVTRILWQGESKVYDNYFDWGLGQLESLISIFVVIAILLCMLRILKLLKIENLMGLILTPLLKMLRVSKDAANLAVVGITLGLSYGGGLIINETKNGNLSRADALITVLLLNLLHSIIEDTALVLLLGADLMMVLWARIIFSIVVMVVISRIYMAYRNRKESLDGNSLSQS